MRVEIVPKGNEDTYTLSSCELARVSVCIFHRFGEIIFRHSCPDLQTRNCAHPRRHQLLPLCSRLRFCFSLGSEASEAINFVCVY